MARSGRAAIVVGCIEVAIVATQGENGAGKYHLGRSGVMGIQNFPKAQ